MGFGIQPARFLNGTVCSGTKNLILEAKMWFWDRKGLTLEWKSKFGDKKAWILGGKVCVGAKKLDS